mmetsp:Transcript_20574/g.48489  ORF Transcript_20574/g.48489 Transcript_20574/m.48489 type:complete len:139 (-) Transcript_20574:120-536(-)
MACADGRMDGWNAASATSRGLEGSLSLSLSNSLFVHPERCGDADVRIANRRRSEATTARRSATKRKKDDTTRTRYDQGALHRSRRSFGHSGFQEIGRRRRFAPLAEQGREIASLSNRRDLWIFMLGSLTMGFHLLVPF